MVVTRPGRSFFTSQRLKLPVPSTPFTSQTVIVTGSTSGIGLEAARHCVRLGAACVILAVRNVVKGEAVRKDIETSTGRTGVVEVWQMDHSSYASVKSFAKRVEGLERLDAVSLNAGINTEQWRVEEFLDMESNINVNVISTYLLALLLLPKLRETSRKFGTQTRLSIVGSFVHALTTFEERKVPEGKIIEGLNVREGATFKNAERYNVSKLLSLLAFRELSSQITATTQTPIQPIIFNHVTPGTCATSIMHDRTAISEKLFLWILEKTLSRTCEEGARTVVHGMEKGPEDEGVGKVGDSWGRQRGYLEDCKVARVSDWVESEDGHQTQKRVWKELGEILERIEPGIWGNI